jgi:protein-S-isoprenylcysteine O-methyltransferase Ste14
MLGGALLANALTTQIVGIILSGAGIAFAIWARFVLGKNWSGIPSIKEGHELIQSGPYAIVRHPIYTGIILSALGDAIAFGFRVEYIAIVFALFVSFWVKLQSEEKLMMKQFPEKYPEYKEKVRGAIIPSVL